MLLTAEARAGLVFPFGEKAFWVAGFIAACAMAAAMLAVGFVVDLSNGHRSLLILPMVVWSSGCTCTADFGDVTDTTAGCFR